MRAPPMTHLTNDSSLGSERAPPLTPTLVSMPSGRELGVVDELKSIPGVYIDARSVGHTVVRGEVGNLTRHAGLLSASPSRAANVTLLSDSELASLPYLADSVSD
jgi:hypothetical protein